MEDLKELSRIAEAATPGPWETLGGQGPFGTHAVCHRMEQGTLVEIAYRDAHFDKTNATHIATFDPPTVLALLTRLEQAEKNAETYQTLYEQRAESLEQAEQAVQRVREVLNTEAFEVRDYVTYKAVPVESIDEALNNQPQTNGGNNA